MNALSLRRVLPALCLLVLVGCSELDTGIPLENSDDGGSTPAPARSGADATVQLPVFYLPGSVGDPGDAALTIRSESGKSNFDCAKDDSGRYFCKRKL